MQEASDFSVKILDFEVLDSTNTYAKDHIGSLEDGVLVSAKTQTAGRGRNGRSWVSPGNEENLYCSFVMKRITDPFRATVVSSLAVLSLLKEHAPQADLFIKWPNDVFAGEEKICGTLCECAAVTEHSPFSVIAGMGINVNTSREELDKIPQKAASLRSLTGRSFERKKLLGKLAENLARYYINYIGDPEKVFLRWKEQNRVLGKCVELEESSGKKRTVLVKDIVQDGRLLCVEGGKEFLFSSGDVRLVKNPGLFGK